ncbi:MAG: ECF transporter S component [Clostridia bacterium]|nr:ECF transporter S component [Clostridia bacterium]
MKKQIHKIIITSMFASICFITTIVIKIPSPLNGYINLGDVAVLLSAWFLSPYCAFYASGIGSALADAFSGYTVYIPATFAIKGVMAIVAYYIFKIANRKFGKILSCVISGAVAELIMIFGYYLFEGLLYGFGGSLLNLPANFIQGGAGLIAGTLVFNIFDKTKKL